MSTESRSGTDVVTRIDGYLPLRDYALIRDGRTTALVGRDGAIAWWEADRPHELVRLVDARAGSVPMRWRFAPISH